jgi:hypothetical protein
LLVAGLGAATLACGTSDKGGNRPTAPLTQDQLLAAGMCAACHPNQYREWSGSMHAYASDDPVFRALNKRMQRETGGALGTFCVQCHAPMATKLGRTKDGLDLDTIPDLKGVTCTFCHLVSDVEGSHNDPLVLSAEPVLGAAIHDPVQQGRTHDAAYVSWLDGTQDNSPGLCGSCHDIVTPAGAAIERTFEEWKTSRFGVGEQVKTSCAACHMPGKDGRAAEVDGAPARTQHDHTMAGVDVALTDFPEKDAQHTAVQAMLDTAITARLCVNGTSIDVALSNRKVGHGWPSGSNQDRRAWIQLTAYAGSDVVLDTGSIPANASVAQTADPLAFVLRDHLFDSAGAETALFWQAARYTSAQLPPEVTSNPASPKYDNSVHKVYPLDRAPDHVTMHVAIRPMDFDFIDELVRSGDLDPAAIAPLSTFILDQTRLDWTPASGACVGN